MCLSLSLTGLLNKLGNYPVPFCMFTICHLLKYLLSCKGSSAEEPNLMRSPEPLGGLLSYIVETLQMEGKQMPITETGDAERYNDLGARLTGC